MLATGSVAVMAMLVRDGVAQAGWPADGLERVLRCPVCDGPDRSGFLDALTDRIFDSAPGEWALQRCDACALLYLDPRPTVGTIGRAYERYYTHRFPGGVGGDGVDEGPGAGDGRGGGPAGSASADASPRARVARAARTLRRACMHGYLDRRYGTRHAGASHVGGLAFGLALPLARYTDANARHLPRAVPGADRLLDVGSGDGAFLDFAGAAGWDATGLDPDPVAVAAGRARGRRVVAGGVEALGDEAASYDLVTASHVIEHVHEPRAFVAALFGLLRPGGRLWLETPNAKSRGLARFGRDWRGLEPPRHLAIFDQTNLRQLLQTQGFTDVRFRNRGLNTLFVHAESLAIRDGTRVRTPVVRPRLTLAGLVDGPIEYVRSSRREFLTVTARRPPARVPGRTSTRGATPTPIPTPTPS